MRPSLALLLLAVSAFASASAANDAVTQDICGKQLLADELKTRLVDKSGAIDALMSAYRDVALAPGDQTALVHLIGAAGTGKTRVLQQFASEVLGEPKDTSIFVVAGSASRRHEPLELLFGHEPSTVRSYPPPLQGLFPKGLLPEFVEKLGQRVGMMVVDEADRFDAIEQLKQVVQFGMLGRHRSAPQYDPRPYPTGKLIVAMTWPERTPPTLRIPVRMYEAHLAVSAELREAVFLDSLSAYGRFVLDVTPAFLAKVRAAATEIGLSPRAMYILAQALLDQCASQGLDFVQGDKLYVRLRRADAPATIEVVVGATQRSATIGLGKSLLDLCQRGFLDGVPRAQCAAVAGRY